LEPCDDEHDEHAGLHNDDEAVEARRLADPDYEDRGDGEDDAHRRHVYQRTGRLPPRARAPYHGLLDLGGGAEQEGWADEGRREVNAEHVEQADEVADQPTPTVAAPMAYSRIKSHPMIHATSSPSVAYE